MPAAAHGPIMLGPIPVDFVLFALILLLNWLNLTSEPTANVVLLPLVGLAVGIAAWSGLWAVISRIFHGQAQFALQLRIAAGPWSAPEPAVHAG